MRRAALVVALLLCGCPPVHIIAGDDGGELARGNIPDGTYDADNVEQPDVAAPDVLEQPDAGDPDAGDVAPPDVVPDAPRDVAGDVPTIDGPNCGAGVDPLWNSYNCGVCGLWCDDLGGRALCQGGQCHQSTVTCGGDASPACRICATDVDCWGYAVPSLTYNRSNGANAHPRCCNGICSPAGDPANCGACGNSCAAGQACGWQDPSDNEVSCF